MSSQRFLFVEMNRSVSGIEFLRATRRLGLQVVLLTQDRLFYRRLEQSLNESLDQLVHEVVEFPIFESLEATLQLCRTLNAQHRFSGLIAQFDTDLELCAHIAQDCGLPYASLDSIKKCRNKWRTRECLSAAGLRTPKYAKVSNVRQALEVSDAIPFPFVLKPFDGAGSENVTLIRTAKDLERPFAYHNSHGFDRRGNPRNADMLVEEWIEGPLVSLETISTKSGVRVLGVTDRRLLPLPDFGAYSAHFPGRLDDSVAGETIEVVTCKALNAVGFDFGPAHTELILSAEGPVVVEINPRIAGGSISQMMNSVLGYSIHEMVLLMQCGFEPIFPEPKKDWVSGYFRLYSSLAGKLAAVDGLDAVRSLPGVVSAVLERNLGDELTGLVKSLPDGVALVTAEAKTHEALDQLLADAVGRLQVRVTSC